MIDTVTLATYVAVVLGFVFIPGPATLLAVARSSTSGTKAGIATGLGISVRGSGPDQNARDYVLIVEPGKLALRYRGPG